MFKDEDIVIVPPMSSSVPLEGEAEAIVTSEFVQQHWKGLGGQQY